MGLADLVAPVSSADGQHGQLSEDDGTADSRSHFLAALHTQTDVSVVVPNSHKGLETGTLTSTGLLLDRHDLEHLIVQRRAQEEVDDLELFDGQREQVDALELVDLSFTD